MLLTLIGRCLNGVKVVGYVIMDKNTKIVRVISKEETDYLVMNKAVDNCIGQIYEGKVLLKGLNCKLIDLPNYGLDGRLITKEISQTEKNQAYLSITARIMKGKSTIGYVIYGLGNSGEAMEKNIEREKVLTLAQEGKLTNARAQKFNNKLLLRGVNCELAQLPVVRV